MSTHFNSSLSFIYFFLYITPREKINQDDIWFKFMSRIIFTLIYITAEMHERDRPTRVWLYMIKRQEGEWK